MKRIITGLLLVLSISACNDADYLYFYDAKVVETDFSSGSRLVAEVTLNGQNPERVICNLKSSMDPVWNRLAIGETIKIVRSSKWKYEAETFCGLLNMAAAKEIISQDM